MSAAIAAFIRSNLRLAPVPSVPEIRLYTAGPAAGLSRLIGDDNDEPPYWAWPWGGGMALARYILDRPELVRGKRVADLGCGGGIVAIAAMKAGAAAADAVDLDARAAVAAELNAAANEVVVAVRCGDGVAGDPPDADLLLIGDLFYEQGLASRVGAFLDRCRAGGLEVLVGDPGRAALPKDRMTLIAETSTPDFGVELGRGLVLRWP